MKKEREKQLFGHLDAYTRITGTCFLSSSSRYQFLTHARLGRREMRIQTCGSRPSIKRLRLGGELLA